MPRWWPSDLGARVYGRIARRDRRVHGAGPLLVAIGDSHTDPCTGYTLPWQVWVRIVGRAGYKTLNLGVSGDTTSDMRQRIVQMLGERGPEIAVLFGGSNDPARDIGAAETEENVRYMVQWLREHGIAKIVLIGTGLRNWTRDGDGSSSRLDEVSRVLGDVAEQEGVIFVDLARFLRRRLDRGEDPDFMRVPYRQSRSWHVKDGDPHFNAYGQRLIAEAFLAATADWRPAPSRRSRPASRHAQHRR
jgi:lysophospholipase L1-like esterase